MGRYAGMIIILVGTSGLLAQPLELKNGFIDDSVKIGYPVKFYLTARYPASLNLLFPDSTHNFAPFEFRKMHYFPTVTSGAVSRDSAVYELVTFELADSLALSLPVYLLGEKDTLSYAPTPDAILLQHVIKDIPPDTVVLSKLPLKTNTIQQLLDEHFNFILAALVAVAIGVILLILWLLFGARLKRYIRKRKLMQNHKRFHTRFNAILEQLRLNFTTSTAEVALGMWKKYAEQLSGKPLTRLTSMEILRQLGDDTLFGALQQIDRSIYGNGAPAVEPLELLQTKADALFAEKYREISHA